MVNNKMVNDKMVNGFMEKKIYNAPLIEVSKIVANGMVLAVSPGIPPFPQPGSPARVGIKMD